MACAKKQSIVLDVVDFIDDIISKGPRARQNMTVLISYVVFVLSVFYLWHHHSDKDFSFVLTMAGMSQTLAFFLLLHKMRVQKSAEGISSKTLQLYCLVFMFRLTSTCVKNGYLPMDATGDWAYQAADITSVFLVFQALFMVHKRYRTTYQDHLDTLPVRNMMVPMILFGCVCHGDLNHSLFFDSVWTIAMNLDTIAMLPQLWMFVMKGGKVEKLASHFVALIFFSRCLTWAFWYTGFQELAPKDGSFNKVGYLLVGMHSLQLLFSADFMFHYFVWQGQQCKESCANGGQDLDSAAGVVLPPGIVQDV